MQKMSLLFQIKKQNKIALQAHYYLKITALYPQNIYFNSM